MTAVCKITNGLDYVSLVGEAFYIDSWRPAGVPFKSDGYWQESAFGEGRRLSSYAIGNIVETITISQTAISQNAALRQINKLANMLLAAADFSTRPKHGRRPIYMEVKATTESNTRYAQIHAGHVGEYGNPFSQPFLQPGCKAAVQGVNVVIEHGPWLESPPGTDVCQPVKPSSIPVEIDGYTYEDVLLGNPPPAISHPAFALWKLNETSGSVAANSSQFAGLDGDYGAGNTLDNLHFWNVVDPSAFMSITNGGVDIYSAALAQRFDGNEGSLLTWVNTSGPIWTGGNTHFFVNIQTPSSYIRIYHPSTPDNSITWEYNADNTSYAHTETGFSATNNWFSVGAIWSREEAKVRFYLNGSIVAYFDLETEWTGDIDSTTANIGSRINDGTDGAAADQAYTAIWDAPINSDDMALIGVAGNPEYLNEVDLACDDIAAYIGNKQNQAALTHVFTADASGPTFGSNLVLATPNFGLLPGTIGVNDAIHLGIEVEADSGLPHGPFNSAVFDILTPANATTSYTYEWEYSQGTSTWGTLSETDNTRGFQEAGINSVHWPQPIDWATDTVNGIDALWVRMRITAVSGTWTQPIARDNPYTITWNTVEIPAGEVGGSLPALGRIKLANPSTSDIELSRVIVGLRTHDIAPNFSSYINLSDVQQLQGVTVDATSFNGVSFQNDMNAATGRSVQFVHSTGTMLPRWTVTMNWAVAQSYLGSYKVFVLYLANNIGGVGFSSAELRVQVGSGYNHTVIPVGGYIVSNASPSPNHIVHEIGEVSIRPDSYFGDTPDQVQFAWWSESSTSLDIDFYALVLIPTDEWFGDFATDPPLSGDQGRISASRYLSLDSTRYLGRAIVADARELETDLSVARWRQSHNGAFEIETSGRQRLHFLLAKSDGETDDFTYGALPHGAGLADLFRNRRYHYGRGSE